MTNLKSKLLKIQSELKAPKNQFNGFGKYKYRNQEDILESVKPLLKKHDLTMTISDDLIDVCDIPIVCSSVCIYDEKDSICVTANAGIDINKKGMDISQSFGSSSSYARKYALNGMFLIDDTKDADSDEQPKQARKVVAKKPKLVLPSENYDKVVSYLEQGNDIQPVLDKYDISSELKKELTKLTNQ
tara:strand:- start:4260 stop:4820 length:561 start_codon:yes stop_codon:yes gene_type:complete